MHRNVDSGLGGKSFGGCTLSDPGVWMYSSGMCLHARGIRGQAQVSVSILCCEQQGRNLQRPTARNHKLATTSLQPQACISALTIACQARPEISGLGRVDLGFRIPAVPCRSDASGLTGLSTRKHLDQRFPRQQALWGSCCF